MLHYIIEVSLCWAVFYLLYHLWLRQETFFAVNRWFLLGSLVLGLFIPFLTLPSLAGPAEAPFAIVYQAPVIIGTEWLEVRVRPEQESVSVPSIWQLLSRIYWTGLTLTLLRFFFGLIQILRLYTEAEVITYPGHKLVRTIRPHLPFSFFNLLFQSQKINLEADEEQQIHRHELAHISGWHSIDVIVVELISIAMWCSPMVYLYRRSLRDVHEYLADAAVLKTTRRKQYSKLLLRQFQSGLQLALANHFIRSQFKNRINMMTKKKSQNGALLKYLLILPVLATAVFLFAKRTGINWNENTTTEMIITARDTLPQTAEVMPRYPGCEELETKAEREACAQRQFLTYIYKGIQYPAEARKAGIQGTVIVQFTISEEGYMQDPKIAKSPGGGLGEEVIRLINAMPPWKPGLDEGKPVAVQMTLPVKFALDDPKQKEVPSDGQFDVMPGFAGCETLSDPAEIKQCTAKKLSQFMAEHIQYPTEAKDLGIEGRVFVQITIDESGKTAAAEIVKGVDPRLDEEALRVAKMMPNWQPALKEGKVVATKLSIPVLFDLPIEHEAVVIGYRASEQPTLTPEEQKKELATLPLKLNGFNLSPNPNNGQFQLQFEAEALPTHIRITDAAGKVVLEEKIAAFTGSYRNDLNLRQKARGTYFLAIMQKGKGTFTHQFIVQ